MAITRSTLKTGPAIVTFDSAVVYFKNGLRITETIETFPVTVDTIGKADERIRDRSVSIAGTPAGEWESLAMLYSHLALNIGDRLHGDDDDALVVHAINGDRWTYHNAALKRMPNLKFAATETLMQECEWVARVKDNTEPTAANSIFTRDTAPFTDTSLSLAAIKTQPYALEWGADPWDSFATAEGIDVTFATRWQPLPLDGHGIVDEILEDIEVTASFKPLGLTQAQIDTKLAIQGAAGSAQGFSLNARGDDLNIVGTDVYVRLRGVTAKVMGAEFGMGKLRNGQIQAVATRDFDTGAALPIAYVGTAAPA
jgi:hypothetical protein